MVLNSKDFQILSQNCFVYEAGFPVKAQVKYTKASFADFESSKLSIEVKSSSILNILRINYICWSTGYLGSFKINSMMSFDCKLLGFINKNATTMQ